MKRSMNLCVSSRTSLMPTARRICCLRPSIRLTVDYVMHTDDFVFSIKLNPVFPSSSPTATATALSPSHYQHQITASHRRYWQERNVVSRFSSPSHPFSTCQYTLIQLCRAALPNHRQCTDEYEPQSTRKCFVLFLVPDHSQFNRFSLPYFTSSPLQTWRSWDWACGVRMLWLCGQKLWISRFNADIFGLDWWRRYKTTW